MGRLIIKHLHALGRKKEKKVVNDMADVCKKEEIPLTETLIFCSNSSETDMIRMMILRVGVVLGISIPRRASFVFLDL